MEEKIGRLKYLYCIQTFSSRDQCSKWFEPRSISSSYSVIVRVRVLLKRTVVELLPTYWSWRNEQEPNTCYYLLHPLHPCQRTGRILLRQSDPNDKSEKTFLLVSSPLSQRLGRLWRLLLPGEQFLQALVPGSRVLPFPGWGTGEDQQPRRKRVCPESREKSSCISETGLDRDELGLKRTRLLLVRWLDSSLQELGQRWTEWVFVWAMHSDVHCPGKQS